MGSVDKVCERPEHLQDLSSDHYVVHSYPAFGIGSKRFIDATSPSHRQASPAGRTSPSPSPTRLQGRPSCRRHSDPRQEREAREAQLALGCAQLSLLDAADPSLDGYALYTEKDVPFELRSSEAANAGRGEGNQMELIRVRVLVYGQHAAPEAVRIELSSESNLFFHYTSTILSSGWRTFQKSQHLTVEFGGLPDVLLQLLNLCLKEPQQHIAVLLMHPDSSAQLDFVKNLEYKFVELLSCNFRASTESEMRRQVSHRYNQIKAQLAVAEAQLADVTSLVKVKSPSLLLQLQRTVSKVHGRTGSPPRRRVGV